MWYVWEEDELLTEFWCGNLKEREHLEHLGADGKILLKCILNKLAATALAGFIWLRKETYIHTYTHTFIHKTYIHRFIHPSIHLYIHTYTHTHAYITHTYTHT
jgi:hypothetical protein